ncbi:MAG TPA: tRNA (adenosine(37)-N6)-dimethylallyltransferase MiaA [Clostridiales bacterium]|nr:tRNA (adenosine(37)-N6)-dimethylallyltransferase MiaA [Clostridiales bacterium]
MKKPLVILTGPTAVGKTQISIKLAKAINGEIVSADSMQVYRHMDIGTAKINKEQMSGVEHYLIDILDPQEEFNVVNFKTYAKAAIKDIYNKGKVPIIVGGTGFYIQALLYDIDFKESKEDPIYRQKLEVLAKEKGNNYLHSKLEEVDSESAIKIHPNNIKKVIRALEYYKEIGEKISEHNKEQRKKDSPFNFSYIVLNDEREHLYERINLRVDEMIEKGLVAEVKELLSKGCKKDMVSMQGLGYKEIISYIEGESSIEESVYRLKRDTRHFAKRQLTWFKREKEVTWIDKNKLHYDNELILNKILEELRKKKIYG